MPKMSNVRIVWRFLDISAFDCIIENMLYQLLCISEFATKLVSALSGTLLAVIIVAIIFGVKNKKSKEPLVPAKKKAQTDEVSDDKKKKKSKKKSEENAPSADENAHESAQESSQNGDKSSEDGKPQNDEK